MQFKYEENCPWRQAVHFLKLFTIGAEMNFQISKEYTSVMKKKVCIQIRGQERTLMISAADKAEATGVLGLGTFKLALKNGDQEVGHFAGADILGWWLDNA